MSAPAAAVGGGLAATLTALAHAPWPIVSGLTVFLAVIAGAQQLVSAWNALMHGIYERRALRACAPPEVLAHLNRALASSGLANLPLTSAEDPTEPGRPG